MSFTVFILAIAIINLVVGFASASYLGWGPRSWDEIDLALNDPQTVSGIRPSTARFHYFSTTIMGVNKTHAWST